jgi:hypothetical protein
VLNDPNWGFRYVRWRLKPRELREVRSLVAGLDEVAACINVWPANQPSFHGPPAFAVHRWTSGCRKTSKIVGLDSSFVELAAQSGRSIRYPDEAAHRRMLREVPERLQMALRRLFRLTSHHVDPFYTCSNLRCSGEPPIPMREEWARYDSDRRLCGLKSRLRR